jgi:flagellar motor switch protein FliG
MTDMKKSSENILPTFLEFHPLSLEVGKDLFRILKSPEASNALSQHLRKEAGLSMGIILPSLKIRENNGLRSDAFALKIREVMVYKGEIRTFHSQNAVILGLKEKLSKVLEKYAYEFLGHEEVQGLLEHVRTINPRVVDAVVPELLSVSEIQQILQNLLKERVPIRDLERILEVLADAAQHTRDPEMLTEYVRHGMPRTLGALYHDGFIIKAFVLEEKIEQWIAGAVRWENQTFLDFHPDAAKKILKAIRKKAKPKSSLAKGSPILLVSPEIRRFVKMFLERNFPDLPVLSYSEISPEYQVKILGTIRMDPWKDKLTKLFPFVKFKKTLPEFPGDNVQKTIVILNMLGPSANLVVQHLSPWEREVLTARSMIAPIPSMGTHEVMEQFFSQLPKEKNIKNLETLIFWAGKEPLLIAQTLQKNWLSHLSNPERETPPFGFSEFGGRDETTNKEKAAIFITSAARWIQDEVYRFLTLEELKELGRSMLQFPFISSEGKRKAWEEYEGILYKDEWWDPDTLARFVRASMKNDIEAFKKRGFRQTQKVAVLLLSLPKAVADKIGNEVLNSLTKNDLLQILQEMGQWRDYLPQETRLSSIQEFLDFAISKQSPDFFFSDEYLKQEVERIVLKDPKGTVMVLRNLWFSSHDPKALYEALALHTPLRTARLLLAFLRLQSHEIPLPAVMKASFFIHAFNIELQGSLKERLTPEEKKALKQQIPHWKLQRKLFLEFLRAYYGGEYPAPIPFLKRN